MRITRLEIQNYRNLDGIAGVFHPETNYLVGENNVGKSNFLDFLNTLFNYPSYHEADFTDKSNPITAELSLKLNSTELGAFDDLFDPTQNEQLNVLIRQEASDENLRFFHKESNQEISYHRMRTPNFLKYFSVRDPKEELVFHQSRGVGRFLRRLIDRYSEGPEAAGGVVDQAKATAVVDFINERLGKIQLVKDFEIKAQLDDVLSDILYRIIDLRDSRGMNIQKTGHGIQFYILILLSILDKLMSLSENPKRDLYVYSSDGKQSTSLIVALDEPEIHLHPYMQRRLVKYLSGLLSNKDAEFLSLIKDLFNLDELDGQLLVATHSPNIISDDAAAVVRMYVDGGSTALISGSGLSLTADVSKHYWRNAPYIKEAFFSRVAILVEGDTEHAAIPLWAEKLIGDPDEFGVCVIRAGGGPEKIQELINKFCIASVLIKDRDAGVVGSTTTTKRDFEEELYDHLVNLNAKDLLIKIVEEYWPNGIKRPIQRTQQEKISGKYGLSKTWKDADYTIEAALKSKDINLAKCVFLCFLSDKSFELGRIIGRLLDPPYIPKVYEDVIKRAKALAK